ncbi:APC family permease [Ruegeria sp.]|uniref:APC family permease n=1 Tax=Ruegeria sp. TaxID=1879320 RepID=UPI00231604C9|nr:APC family permease [Ruegeria sp.]MDA7963678.1 APC family permease [Ruegeria sp.]
MTSDVQQTGTLKRTLGFSQLLAVGVGLVVSQGVMVLMLQGAGIGGFGFFTTMGLAYLLALFYVFSFAELSLLFKSPGTLSTYTEAAIGNFPAIVAVFAGYLVVAMFALSAELVLIELMLKEVIGIELPPMVLAIGLLAIFTLLNIRGVDIFATMQSALSFIMIAAISLIGLASIYGVALPRPESQLVLKVVFADSNVLALLALAIWGFVGLEFVCPLVSETKDPERNIPRSMIIGATVILAMYVVYCLGALLYVPQETLAGSALPHYEYVGAVFGETGLVFLTLAAFTATCSTVNTSLAAVPRMLFGMAKNGQTFSAFGKLHPKYNTPWVAIVFVAVVTGGPIFVYGVNADAIILLLVGAAIAWLLAYIIVHIDVIVLRRRYPDRDRPFKTPLYPLPQILGIIGMAYAIWNASPAPELTKQVFSIAGGVLLAGALFAAYWVKVVMKKGLFTPEPIDHLIERDSNNQV